MIAQKLRYYRLIYRITQTELAAAAGMRAGNIAKIESRNTDVTISTAVKIANALEVRLDKLVGDLTESEREEMRIANRMIADLREERRIAGAREKKRRYKERKAKNLTTHKGRE